MYGQSRDLLSNRQKGTIHFRVGLPKRSAGRDRLETSLVKGQGHSA